MSSGEGAPSEQSSRSGTQGITLVVLRRLELNDDSFLRTNRELGVLKTRLKQAAQGLQPAIYRRRTREAELLQELGIRVLDWQDLRQSRDLLSQRFMNISGYAQPRMSSRVCAMCEIHPCTMHHR